MGLVVAIDGPSGVGKSTTSRLVAGRLGLPYLNTGATYRAATLAVVRAGTDPGDAAAAAGVVAAVTIDYRDERTLLDGEDVSDEIRSPRVTAAVSPVSAIPEVRELVVAMQRRWVEDMGGSAVVEGRDIGTTVFPDAPCKVFLTARPDVRARRRSGDREVAGQDAASVARDLAARDRIDSTRTTSPLHAAADATVIDTSELTLDEVVAAVVAACPERD